MDVTDTTYATADIREEDVPEIVRAEMRLAEVIGSLDTALSELEKRLERVLRPEDPTNPEKETLLLEVRPATTQLTDFMNAQASRVEAEYLRITNILGRLGL